MALKYLFLLVVLIQLDLFSKDGLGVNAIYRGRKAEKEKFKWVALIYSESELLCHGVLLSNEFVLTLASCVKENDVTHVVVGEYDRSVEGDGEQVLPVFQTILHPDNSFLTNNVALVQLQLPANLSSPCIEAITNFASLDDDEEINSGADKRCQIAGWGERLVNGTWVLSDKPYELKVEKEKDQVCRNLGLTGLTHYSCFKMSKYHSGPCYSDNGTPVIYKIYGKKILMGLMYGQFSVDGCVGGIKLVNKASSYKFWLKHYLSHIQLDPRKPTL